MYGIMSIRLITIEEPGHLEDLAPPARSRMYDMEALNASTRRSKTGTRKEIFEEVESGINGRATCKVTLFQW